MTQLGFHWSERQGKLRGGAWQNPTFSPTTEYPTIFPPVLSSIQSSQWSVADASTSRQREAPNEISSPLFQLWCKQGHIGPTEILCHWSQLLCQQLQIRVIRYCYGYLLADLYDVLLHAVVVLVECQVLQELIHLGLRQWHGATSLVYRF